ncbi:MAG: DUF2027 domain-containing protein [Bacteroidales bacterium]|nr:DUF2027 domain-containing protein [Bacteroidales bacterium]
MKYKVGDKVKFLNESGGGIVSKIISSTMVNVAIEDGFDIPTMTRDLVKIEDKGIASNYFKEEYNVATPVVEAPSAMSSVQAEQPEYSRESVIRPTLRGVNPDKGIYLVYMPQTQNMLLMGLIDVYLYNNTDYEVLFNLVTKNAEGSWEGRDYDSISPKSRVLLDSIEREDLNDWTEGVVQVLFNKDKMDKVLLPGHYSFKIKASRFYKEESFKSSLFSDNHAIILNLGLMAEQDIQKEDELSLKYEENQPKERKAKEIKIKELIENHKIADREAEVDLHISSLKEDYKLMKKNEILQYQISYFERTLDNAMVNKYNKVTYIHGIGNGTLRMELIKELRTYDELTVRSAPFSQYGNGAIEVIING